MASRATSLSQLRCRIVNEVAKIVVVGLLLSDVVEFAWAQTGFISIDCGSTTPYTDANNISWVPDTTYISTGQNYNAQDVASNESSTLKTLRYFPENQAKNCYVLPVIFNQTYLIRASFLFTKSFLTAAGYNASSSTTFYYSIDPNLISILEFSTANSASLQDASVLETVLASTSDKFYVCLARSTSTDVPFISSLELRQLYDGMYADRVYSGYYLDLVNRANWGSSTPVVRYPDDPYDRLWLGATNPTTTAINTSITISTTTGGGPTDRPPGLVLQTAEVWPPGTTGSLSLTDLTPNNNVFYLATYFAEIDPLAQNESRIFDLVLNGKITYADDSVKDKIIPGEVVLYAAFEVAGTELLLNSSSTLTFVPHPNSTLGPFLGASEIYQNTQVQALTFAPDASAIESITTQLNLSTYSGDPCVYTPYDWINCTQVISPPRIVSIKLSNFNLSNVIPTALNQLTYLNELWLDSNNFTGTIPDLSNLTQLQSLHLENNALDGNLPAWIGSLPVLTELNVTNNDLTGEIPATIQNNSRLQFQYAGNLLCNGTICTISPSPSSNHNSNNLGVIVGTTVAGLLVVAAIIVLVVFRSYKRRQNDEDKEKLVEIAEGTALPPGSNFSLLELEIATDNFKQLLGTGGFGAVFYGRLPSGKEVAVKKLVSGSQQGAGEFFNEVHLLSRIRHKNLVSLVGFCQEGEEKILVYEFMTFGTLREHLYGTEKAIREPMSWRTRLSIALDAAQGLEYLHEGCMPSIIHRDVKSSNILLSSKLVGKIADFGLSKLTTVEGASHVSTLVKGTAGYLDPEYYMNQQLTEKSDVFSFGIVLLEIICGRQPIDTALQDRKQWNIGEWAKPHLEAGDIHSVIDKALDNKFNEESIWKVAQIARMSIDLHGENRPSMRQVVRNLREAIAMEGENSIPPTNSTRPNLSHPHASQSSSSSIGGSQSSRGNLELATNHFKELIGQGSFGPVFLGRLYNGSEVAIKRRSDTSQVGTDSFLNEVMSHFLLLLLPFWDTTTNHGRDHLRFYKMTSIQNKVNLLSQVHHPNLVQLIGYYTSSEKKNPVQMLVYEYMSGGTLMDHLYGRMTGEGILEWRDRLSLTVGAATGLEYLHNGSDPKIIHRDVKSSNILISSENVAKVSDFGLSKLIADLDKTHVTTAVKGTAGYLDPEYFTSQQLTEKSDVYSFGVVLMEILFAREPISGNYGPEAYNLTAWQMIPKGDYSMLDPSLESHFNPRSLEIVTSLAVRCTHQHGMKRPTIAEVLRELKRALAIEEGGASFEMPSFKQSPKVSEDMHFTAPTPR
ncbi:unnamed protein product [Sphagnum balticum]